LKNTKKKKIVEETSKISLQVQRLKEAGKSKSNSVFEYVNKL
jgi:hypothetical protein